MTKLQGVLPELEACLATAQEVLERLPQQGSIEAGQQQEVLWIERQIASVTKFLMALQADINAGLNAPELGFTDEHELRETVLDLARQLQLLLARSRVLGRGRHL